ncbi:hypothetical protein COCON_G00031160 [Conger conger]|uniref:Uncharacterized protein n=1 Tax=Conger conger TaxID=82655 RepID=A0A9Q1I769_CONCO|nr:hypothetical protein COCON_G00031160 [Conger conger]
MDPTPSPLARVGQVFWVVLRFVTGAVQRYLIPEPANTGNDDTHTGQEATISVATETQEWTGGDKDKRENIEGAEKKMKKDRESVADTHDSWTDEPTTEREKKAKGPQFTNEKNESESERHGSISNCGVQTHEDIIYGADTEMGGERQTEKETGSQKYREIGKAFNTRDTSTGRGNKILREEESGWNLEGERTITDVLGKETEGGSLQRTDGDKKDQSECRVRKLETNWDEGNKVTIQEEREGEGENSESKIEIETGEKIENSEGGWIDVPTKEQQMQKSERGQNGNSALGRQIGASNKDGVITDLENTELSQTEVTVGNKGNESIEYSEEDEIKSIEIRKIETENREFKEIAKECGVVTGEKENKNLMAKREEEETKTMREEKKEHERHVITELFVGQGNRGMEMEGGPVSEEEDAKEETEVEEEERLILMEATGGKNTKEVGPHEYSGEMEVDMWGTEEKVEEIEVRPELLVPIPVERNDKDVLNEETHSDVEDDYFTKETETDKDADEKDLGILKVEEEERLILMEATGGKNTKEVGEHEYSGQMEASIWGTEEIVEEIEVRPELLVPISVEINDKDVLNEETHSDVEDDYFTKETETDKDADEKDLGILGTDEDERITDIGRNENSFIEMTVTNKEQEQRQSEGCSEDKDMESVEMRKLRLKRKT